MAVSGLTPKGNKETMIRKKMRGLTIVLGTLIESVNSRLSNDKKAVKTLQEALRSDGISLATVGLRIVF